MITQFKIFETVTIDYHEYDYLKGKFFVMDDKIYYLDQIYYLDSTSNFEFFGVFFSINDPDATIHEFGQYQHRIHKIVQKEILTAKEIYELHPEAIVNLWKHLHETVSRMTEPVDLGVVGNLYGKLEGLDAEEIQMIKSTEKYNI